MSKKAKKRKSRKLSSSSSEDDKKTRSNRHETTKRKNVPSKEMHDVAVPKAKDPSTSKEEPHGKRQIKKPVYRLEKNKPTRGQSPIFKEEEREKKSKPSKSKTSRSSSSKDGRVASSSQAIFIPRLVSRQKSECQSPPVTKKCRDASPPTPKVKEAKKSSPVRQVISPLRKNEPLKTNQPHQEEKMKIKSFAIAPSRWTTAATISSKTKTPPGPQHIKEKKEFTIVLPKSRSKIINNTLVAEKLASDSKSLPIKSDHKSASCTAKSSQRQSQTPAAATDKFTASSIKTTFPGHKSKKYATVPPQPPSRLPRFRIPKKAGEPETSSAKDNKALPVKSRHANSPCEATSSSVPQSSSRITTSSNVDVQKQDPWQSLVSDGSPAHHADPSPWQDEMMMVVEQLHQARSDKLLEVNVMQSYGELTCMEIDPPEEGAADTQCKELPQQNIIIVLDTNILISHLEYVKKIVSRGFEVVFPVVLIPWVVLQELDSLKKGKGVSGSVARWAIPAISYIYNSLKGRESRLWGQSMQQAAESTNRLNVENNDDRVLQCCLQYQLLYPECAVILCTNDKNLCSKALLSGVKAFSKIDLETEVARFSQGAPFLLNLQASISPQATPAPGKVHALAETQSKSASLLSVEKVNNQTHKINAAQRSHCHLSGLVCQFESVLQEALSDVLQAEMKAAFQDLWLEIVYRKPPWSLRDVLQCLKKHWIAVFGHIVPRAKHQNVLNLIEFFNSGKGVDCNSAVVALQEAKDLLKEFVRSSSHVPSAITAVNNLLNTLQTQGESSGSDVVMKEAEEDKQSTSPPVSHAEVWALFGDIWHHVYQTSLEVFKAVDFNPKACQSVRPTGGPPPPRDALACLHKLLCMVSQLLQGFSSFLTSSALAEAQSLLNVMQSTEIVNVDKVTAADLLNCFAQEEYRERLRTGGGQLLEVQAALSSCLEFTGLHLSFAAQP